MFWVLLIWLLAVAGIANAVMDMLQHHWSGSIFYRISGGDRLHFWGAGSEVWKRRYVDNDPMQEWKPLLRNRLLRLPLLMVWDGWHLAQTVMWIAICAAVALAVGPPWVGIVAWFAILGPFTLFYKRIL